MEWRVTAFNTNDSLVFWLESHQTVVFGQFNEMEFGVRPTERDDEGRYHKWQLLLVLRDGRDVIAQEKYLYDTLAQATTDAEAIAEYLQSTTDSPGGDPEHVPTQFPVVRTVG